MGLFDDSQDRVLNFTAVEMVPAVDEIPEPQFIYVTVSFFELCHSYCICFIILILA